MAKTATVTATPRPTDVASALPPLQPNKRFVERQKYKAKLKARAEERERVARHGGRKQLEQLEQRKRRAKAAAKKKKAASRRVKTTIGSAKTGNESLRKVKARELVRQTRRDAAAKLQQRVERQRARKRDAGSSSDSKQGNKTQTASTSAATEAAAAKDEERALLSRVICGRRHGNDDDDDMASDDALLPSHATSLSARAAVLSPAAATAATMTASALSFVDDYAAAKRAEVVQQEAVLQQAHAYFKNMAKKEKQLHKAAAQRLRELKAINRRGGDKDGFRYVVPSNVKEMAEQMRMAQQGGVRDRLPTTATTTSSTSLTSSFGGDDPIDVTDKPMRRRRRRSSTFDDFYQFQVSRQWTRNAENFLRRGRAHKALFEAKKQQRSIRKL